MIAVALLSRGDAETVAWDDRLAPLATFVEGERGLRFEAPVPVEFLDDAGFEARLDADQELDEEERRELDETAAVFRALGLLDRGVDLEGELRSLQGGSTLAFYDDEEREIVVKGTELSPQVRSTVVHELTHALQDQHFDLSRLEDLHERGDGGAFHGLVEGDASRIATAYEQRELDDGERAALAEEDAADLRELDVDRFPPALAALLSTPYVLGEPFVETIEATGGQDAVDRAFRDPPLRDEALLDPLTFVEGDEVEDVEDPVVPEGAQVVDDGVFEAFGWYLVLALRVDPLEALDAADGWGGDRYVAYRADGRVCVRVAWVGERETDADELEAAAESWGGATPESTRVARVGVRRVDLESCEPATEGPDATTTAEDLLVLPAVRARAQAAVLAADRGALTPARCYGRRLVHELTVDELVAEEPDPVVERRVVDILAACREGG